ncbi:hypothetical protein Tco_1034079 [Tanacetum coccineum]
MIFHHRLHSYDHEPTPSCCLNEDVQQRNETPMNLVRVFLEFYGFNGIEGVRVVASCLDWDARFEEGLICDGDIIKREEWIMDLDQLDRMHREDLKQKCRIRWAIKGDKNSRFFHSLLKCKYVNTNIKGIHVNGIWQDDPDVIKNAGMDYFSSRFKEPLLSKPSFNSSLFKRLSNQEAHSLESNLSILKIKEAVWDCAGSKAPGPDGFNFNFIKA